MYPPIFSVAAATPAVTALIGTNPVRLYLFGEATQATAKPYAVWQVVFGSPENFLSGVPSTDSYGIQIDVYGNTALQSRNVAKTLRDAFESGDKAYVTAWNGEFKESETNLYRYSFTVEWFVDR